jgi:hypothetical protein
LIKIKGGIAMANIPSLLDKIQNLQGSIRFDYRLTAEEVSDQTETLLQKYGKTADVVGDYLKEQRSNSHFAECASRLRNLRYLGNRNAKDAEKAFDDLVGTLPIGRINKKYIFVRAVFFVIFTFAFSLALLEGTFFIINISPGLATFPYIMLLGVVCVIMIFSYLQFLDLIVGAVEKRKEEAIYKTAGILDDILSKHLASKPQLEAGDGTKEGT